MSIGIITLFPNMFKVITDYGIISKAIKKGILNIKCWNPRDYTNNNHDHVDDRPYGGGPGMVMMAKPLLNTINQAKKTLGNKVKVIYLSPQGSQLNYKSIKKFTEKSAIILVCGRYEGIDDRVTYPYIDEELSIGDYVLSGGELAAMVFIDAVARFIPGVLGQISSAIKDSFTDGLLDYPHFTRPKIINNISVPSVLLSGNHNQIDNWRKTQSLIRTLILRPELLLKLNLTEEQKYLFLIKIKMLNIFIQKLIKKY